MGEKKPTVIASNMPEMHRVGIKVPVPLEVGRYRVTTPETGEIWECADLAVLLRYVAKQVCTLRPKVPGFIPSADRRSTTGDDRG